MRRARRIAKAADRRRTRERELAARAASISDRRPRARTNTEAKPTPVQQLVRFGAVAAFASYFAAHLRLLALFGAIAAGLTAWYFIGHFQTQHPPATQTGIAAPAKSPPVPLSRPIAGDAPPRARVAANASSSRSGDIASMPAKPSAQNGAIVAARDPLLDRWFVNSYLRCWKPPTTLPLGEQYAAQIRISHNLDGSIAPLPVLVNPPSNPILAQDDAGEGAFRS